MGAQAYVDERPYILFPEAGAPVVIFMSVVFLGLIGLAVFLEFYRRKRQRDAAYRRAWLNVERIFREKDLSQAEREAVRGLIEYERIPDPLSIVTTRRAFNAHVGGYMEEMRHKLDPASYAQLGQTLRDVRIRLALDFVPFGQPIRSTRELTPGQTILARRKEHREESWFRLRVDSVDEAYVTVETQSVQGGAAAPALVRGERLTARLWRRDDGRYALEFETASALGPDATLPLHHDNQIKRTQSRAYLRIRHNQPASVSFVALAPHEQKEAAHLASRPASKRLRGRITSLSGGGLALELDQPPPQNVALRVPIDLPGSETLTAHAVVVGSHQLSGGRYLVRGAFVEIGDEERDAIAGYVWERQQPLGPGPHAAT